MESREYEMGFECGADGPNERNCHFSLFATPAQTANWERGKFDGELFKRGLPIEGQETAENH